MRGAELIGCRVVDPRGQDVGHVHDLVFRHEHPGDEDDAPRFELAGLECGKAGIGDRLGYTRDAMAGPWPLTVLFRWLGRRSLFVPWSKVTTVDRPRIEIGCAREELRPFIEVEDS